MKQQIPPAYYAAFVGAKYPVYKKKWRDKDPERLFVGWNWCGFFVGHIWLLYRKMYREYVIIALGSIALSFLQVLLVFFFPSLTVLRVVEFHGLTQWVIALFGDSLYHRKAHRTISTAVESRDGSAKEMIKQAGGTSVGAIFIAAAIEVLFYYVLRIIFAV